MILSTSMAAKSQRVSVSHIKKNVIAHKSKKLSTLELWKFLSRQRIEKMDRKTKAYYFSVLSGFMEKKYPVASALYAYDALSAIQRPMKISIKKIDRVASRYHLNHMMDELVTTYSESTRVKSWKYYYGISLEKKNNIRDAVKTFKSIPKNSRHYWPAQYRIALILVDQGRNNQALKILLKMRKEVVGGDFSDTEETRLVDLSSLTAARIFYEEKKFLQSIKLYRSISRDGLWFQDALSEQAWAFFMSGHPNHALGALHGAGSPFFDTYRPEDHVLQAISYFWMCRYDQSRIALQSFIDNDRKVIVKLKTWLSKRRVSPMSAYRLFEDVLAGVSSSSLELPRPLLQSAMNQPSMMAIRSQLADALEERNRMQKDKIFKSTRNQSIRRIMNWEKSLKQELGRQFITELKSLEKEYDGLNQQVDFLMVELLMSEADQVLGKELHSSLKFDNVSRRLKVQGWGRVNNQSWASDNKGEYWWDEVGYYIYQENSACRE